MKSGRTTPSRRRIAFAGLLATVLSAGVIGVVAPSADAAGLRNGVCDNGEFCYYYNTNQGGSVSDLRDVMATYRPAAGCYTFRGSGAGQWQCVDANAASVWNRTGKAITVYTARNFDVAYASQVIPAGAKVNLNSSVKNKNKSHRPSSVDSDPKLLNGVCDSGEFCYYYYTNQGGSLADLYIEDMEYAKGNSGGEDDSCVAFVSAGSGQYQCIRNNAQSVWNRSNVTIRVYYRPNFNACSYDQEIPPNTKANLNSILKDDNASHRQPV
jgi:hypothetical protein